MSHSSQMRSFAILAMLQDRHLPTCNKMRASLQLLPISPAERENHRLGRSVMAFGFVRRASKATFPFALILSATTQRLTT